MKKKLSFFTPLLLLLLLVLACLLITRPLSHSNHREEDNDPGLTLAKPVIYLYPEEEIEVTVRLDLDGSLTCTYPAYDDGWTVNARPDGTLTDEHGQTYNYLYWEGLSDAEFDFSQGFCIPGADTAAFLEDALAQLGLNRR